MNYKIVNVHSGILMLELFYLEKYALQYLKESFMNYIDELNSFGNLGFGFGIIVSYSDSTSFHVEWL